MNLHVVALVYHDFFFKKVFLLTWIKALNILNKKEKRCKMKSLYLFTYSRIQQIYSKFLVCVGHIHNVDLGLNKSKLRKFMEFISWWGEDNTKQIKVNTQFVWQWELWWTIKKGLVKQWFQIIFKNKTKPKPRMWNTEVLLYEIYQLL